MKPRITLITLAVADLDRAFRFYHDGLGFPSKGIVGKEFEHGAVAFFDLDAGLRLALWPRESLAFDSGLPAGSPDVVNMALAHNVADRTEVDAVMALAGQAGATVVKAPHDTFWGGYAAYFRDLDGHLWEVAWNPEMLPADPA